MKHFFDQTPSYVIAHTNLTTLRNHPSFVAAKAGDPMAAMQVVKDLIKREPVRAIVETFPEATVVPVLAMEETGANMLPLALAAVTAAVGHLTVEIDIVQTNRTCHTSADAIHRLLHRPIFDGRVIPGATYIVVDDVITTGSTVQALRLFLESRGGRVVAFSAMAASFSPLTGSSLQIDIRDETLDAIETKFGSDQATRFLRTHGIAQASRDLTNSQGRYLLAFRNLNSIRARITNERNTSK